MIDAALVLCLEVDAHPYPPPAPSVMVPCDVCGVGVWLSMATRADLDDRRETYRPVCRGCGRAILTAEGVAPMYVAPGPRTIEAVRLAHPSNPRPHRPRPPRPPH